MCHIHVQPSRHYTQVRADVGSGRSTRVFWPVTARLLSAETAAASADRVCGPSRRAFDDPYLLDSYCETALLPPVSQRNATAEADDGQLVGLRGDRVIRNKLLFTHSMANTILSKAIHEGVCTIDRNTTAWYMSQGPMQGTKAAETIANICSGITVLDKPVRWIAAAENYCDGRNVSAAYWSLRPGYPAYNDALLDVPRQFADGAMCGTSPYGETSMYSAALEAVAYVVEYGEDNDGLVPLSSCDAWFRSEQPTASFLDPTANFYTPKANHADGTCRVGDGWFAKPCTWYATKMGKPDGAVEPLGRKIVLPGRHANAMAPRAAAAAW